MNIAGVVLAGGQSSRMGSDKSLLKINGQTLLERATELLVNSGIKNTVISGQNGIQDKYPNKGPIGGILSTLISLKEYSQAIIIPVDMPLLTSEIIQELKNCHRQDLCYFEKHNLPLIMKNNLTIRTKLECLIENNSLSLYGFFEQIDTKILKSKYEEDCFLNANSPEQWQNTIQKLLK